MLKNRWIGLGLIGAMLAFSAVIYNQLPARVPTHWNINGVADGFGTRELGALLVPGISLPLWAQKIVLGDSIDGAELLGVSAALRRRQVHRRGGARGELTENALADQRHEHADHHEAERVVGLVGPAHQSRRIEQRHGFEHRAQSKARRPLK